MFDNFKSGEVVGNGSAINVEVGFIPDYVEVINVTDSDKITIGFPNRMVIPFSSGGTNPIEAGDTIVGGTSHARAVVKEVLLYSGSFAGGDAAGFLTIERQYLVGTFGSEAVAVDGDGTTDDATVTVNVVHAVDIDTEVAAATGNAGISAYVGAAGSNAKGFTIGSTVAEEAKLLRWIALRG